MEDENLSMLDPVTGVSVFSLSSPDGNESLSLRVEFVTEGSHQIFAEGVSIADTNGVYLLTESQLDTFEIVPESGFGTMRLEISAVSTEASNSDVAQSNSQFFEFDFAKVSDPPVLSSSSTVEGTEDNMVTQGLPLGLGASVPSGTSLEAFIAMVIQMLLLLQFQMR